MTQGSVRLWIPFESLVDSIAESSLKDKLRLWELLGGQIAQAEEEAWKQDPTLRAEIREARAAYQVGDYVTLGEIHQLTLDPSGHILIPPAIRARLGLAPGMTFVVEERDDKELVLHLQDEEPLIVDKDGVLVVQSQAVGDIGQMQLGGSRTHGWQNWCFELKWRSNDATSDHLSWRRWLLGG